MQPTFETLYNRLNKAQKEAVDAIEGPVMVIAGPGTGKTSILTLRIANILRQTDTSPENILALTFTESGAKAMKKKLVEIVGTRGYKVRIATFHGFCNGIIKEFPEKFDRIIGGTSITDVDQIRILETILSKNKFEHIKPYGEPLYYIRPILNIIKNLKREAISVDVFAQSVAKQHIDFENIADLYHQKGAHKGKMKGEYTDLKKKIEKNKEIITVYESYEKSLKKEKLYDYEDMIIETVKAFKSDEDFLLQIQETYQYILADEHQDANNAQNTILELLSGFHATPNLFIVGDEKQAIFKFQGASLENFLYFKNKFPEATVIELKDNYRSTQTILDAAHTLIKKGVQLNSHSSHTANISVIAVDSPLDEARYIAEDIKEKEDVAVLYRDNRDAFLLGKVFEKYGIPYIIESDQDILHNIHIRKLVLLLRMVHDPSNTPILARALFIDFLHIDPLQIMRNKDLLSSAEIFLPDLKKWVTQGKNKAFIDFFQTFIRESGYLAYAMAEAERFTILTSFFDEIQTIVQGKKEYYLEDFLAHIDLLETHGILIKNQVGKGKGVRLMTAHRSKGLEFDHVYIMGVNDGHWGGKTKRNYFTIPILGEGDTSIEDERRLFYVALTRARQQVTITYHTEHEALPSQFIAEIDEKLISKKEKQFTDTSTFVFSEDKHIERDIISPDITKQKFLEQGLAVTALNNYLECSWKYFFVNLIRIPQAPSKHQLYGIAIHETLRAFFNRYKEEKDMPLAEALEFFDKRLLYHDDIETTQKKGHEALTVYLKKGNWNRNIFTEYNIETHIDVGGESVILKGNLDKVELISPDTVNVVDYKTGQYKSKNKDNYIRQLRFYKLLLSLEKKFTMMSGELDYIESAKKDHYDITDEDVAEVLTITKKVSTEIMSGDFSKNACGEKDCEFCNLAQLL